MICNEDIREDITLNEQQFGLFDSITNEQRQAMYPNENAEYIRQVTNQGKFYARLPMGESPFDVQLNKLDFNCKKRRFARCKPP